MSSLAPVARQATRLGLGQGYGRGEGGEALAASGFADGLRAVLR